MKKIIVTISLIMACNLSFAQKDTDSKKEDQKKVFKSEISTNLFDLVVAGSLNFDYEHLIEGNQSFLIGITAFDTYGYYDAGYLEESNAFSLRAAWIVYTSRYEKHGGFHFYPMLKLRTGSVTPNDPFYIIDSNNNYVESTNKSYDIAGFSAGFGLGYKWVVNDKFTLSVNGELARNLGRNIENENVNLSNVEPRFGVNFGYRF